MSDDFKGIVHYFLSYLFADIYERFRHIYFLFYLCLFAIATYLRKQLPTDT